MEFPPTEWVIFGAEEFETAPPRDPGDMGMEVMVQMRPNGRVMDHWRIALGGSKILEVKVKLTNRIPAAAQLPDAILVFQKWPADVAIRRNMTTSAWFDVLDLLTANEVSLVTAEGDAVDNATAVETLGALKDKATNSAVWRWAVAVGEDGKLELQLQALPAPLTYLNKPIFKR